MLLFISKFIRIIKNDFIPKTCYAYQWLPHSCDCPIICKYKPKGNTQNHSIKYNLSLKNQF